MFPSGHWEVPVITGNPPPPCTYFSSNTLSSNRGVMFGGTVVDESGKHRVNDLFLFSCFQNTVVSIKNVINYFVLLINELLIPYYAFNRKFERNIERFCLERQTPSLSK